MVCLRNWRKDRWLECDKWDKCSIRGSWRGMRLVGLGEEVGFYCVIQLCLVERSVMMAIFCLCTGQ